MKIIEIKPLPNGAHRNQTIQGGMACPRGWAIIPENMPIPETFPFVTIEVEGQRVVTMTAGTVPEPEPGPEPEPSEADDLAAMTVDHEYRLTLLELGVTEGGEA